MLLGLRSIFSFAVLVLLFRLVLLGLVALVLVRIVLPRIVVVDVVIWERVLRLIRIDFAVSAHRGRVHDDPATVQVRFDPSVSRPADDELAVFNLAPLESQDHAGGNFELTQHQGECRIELLAVTFVTLQQKCFERIDSRQTGVRLLVNELPLFESREQSLGNLDLVWNGTAVGLDCLSCELPQVI